MGSAVGWGVGHCRIVRYKSLIVGVGVGITSGVAGVSGDFVVVSGDVHQSGCCRGTGVEINWEGFEVGAGGHRGLVFVRNEAPRGYGPKVHRKIEYLCQF